MSIILYKLSNERTNERTFSIYYIHIQKHTKTHTHTDAHTLTYKIVKSKYANWNITYIPSYHTTTHPNRPGTHRV